MVRRAFTLLELLVALAVVGVLVALSITAIRKSRDAAENLLCTNNLRRMWQGLNGLRDSNGGVVVYSDLVLQPVMYNFERQVEQNLFRTWAEAADCAPPNLVKPREAYIHPRNGKRYFTTPVFGRVTPWACPSDRPFIFTDQAQIKQARNLKPGWTPSGTLFQTDLWSYDSMLLHLTLTAVLRGNHRPTVYKRVTQMFDDAPDVPVIRDGLDFHRDSEGKRYRNAVHSDGSARRDRCSDERWSEFLFKYMAVFPQD